MLPTGFGRGGDVAAGRGGRVQVERTEGGDANRRKLAAVRIGREKIERGAPNQRTGLDIKRTLLNSMLTAKHKKAVEISIRIVSKAIFSFTAFKNIVPV